MSPVKAKRDSKEENIFLSKLYTVIPIILNMLYSLISHLNSIYIYSQLFISYFIKIFIFIFLLSLESIYPKL